MDYLPACGGAGPTGQCVSGFPINRGVHYLTPSYLPLHPLIFEPCGIFLACPHVGAQQYQDNVVGPGSPKYDQAYYEVNYLRAYTTGSPTPTGGINKATALPAQQNAGVSSYLQPPWLLSLGVATGLSLFCGLW